MDLHLASKESDRLLFPLKFYFDFSYYAGYCPFKIVKTKHVIFNNLKRSSTFYAYSARKNRAQRAYTFVITITLILFVSGTTFLKTLMVTQSPKSPKNFFDGGISIFYAIAMLLNIYHFWYNEDGYVRIFNFVNDPTTQVREIHDDYISKSLRIAVIIYCTTTSLACGIFHEILGTTGYKIDQLVSLLKHYAPRNSDLLNVIYLNILSLGELEMYSCIFKMLL